MSTVVPKEPDSKPIQTRNLHCAKDYQGFLCGFDNYRSTEAKSWLVRNNIPRLAHTIKAIRQVDEQQWILRTSFTNSFSVPRWSSVKTSSIANTKWGSHIKDGKETKSRLRYLDAISLTLGIRWVLLTTNCLSSPERHLGRACWEALPVKAIWQPPMTWDWVRKWNSGCWASLSQQCHPYIHWARGSCWRYHW